MTKPTSGTFSRRPIVLMLFMLGLFWAGSLVLFQNGASSDLFALWLAADAFGSGQLQSIYPPAGEVFLMHPPLSWVAEAQALGQPGPYYPYIYPPLFAALLSPATEVMNFAQFQTVFSYVNAFLLCGTIPLAMRASRLDMAPVAYLAIAIGLSSISTVSLLATHENQPQILVTFLMVLALERTMSGRSGAAGAVLACAAAIKVYPAFFMLVFLLRRDLRAVIFFFVVGTFLGGLSIVLAGWPLHQIFLDQLATISRTVLVNTISLNLNSLWAATVLNDKLEFVRAVGASQSAGEAVGWHIIRKTDLWGILGMVGLAAVVFAAAIRSARNALPPISVLVGMICAASLLLPMSWSYYFYIAIAFAPLLIDRYGIALGSLIILAGLGPTFILVPSQITQLSGWKFADLFAATSGMVLVSIAFLFAPSARTRP